MKLSAKQKELIESFGVIQERMGMSPASARVNAVLTVSSNPELSFDELKETTGLSKGSISTAVNNLIALEYIGYKTKTGDRKRYFFSRLDNWKTKFRKDILALNNYNNVMREILENRGDMVPKFNQEIKELIRFMEYFVTESVNLIDNWEK